MKLVLQRVKNASVTIDKKLHSSINKGILIFIGIEKGDTEADVIKFAEKVAKLRIFADENDKMNLSIKDIKGEILVVSQFTLAGDCKKGTRPRFDKSAPPEEANRLYELFTKHLQLLEIPVQTGVFGAMMDIALINDGPVTFILG